MKGGIINKQIKKYVVNQIVSTIKKNKIKQEVKEVLEWEGWYFTSGGQEKPHWGDTGVEG